MTINMYSLYDSELEEFNFPFPAKTDKVAIRQVKQFFESAKAKDKYFNASNFKLSKVGVYCIDDGCIESNVENIDIDFSEVEDNG